jgi:hypothetical protein
MDKGQLRSLEAPSSELHRLAGFLLIRFVDKGGSFFHLLRSLDILIGT